jgi:hypothetical protein
MAYTRVKSLNAAILAIRGRWGRSVLCQGKPTLMRKLTGFSNTQPKSAIARALATPEEDITFGINPLPFRLYTKSHIDKLFERYAPHLDARLFVAAAHVFPMRVNNYVAENLIDWYVEVVIFLMVAIRHAMNPFSNFKYTCRRTHDAQTGPMSPTTPSSG